MAGSQRGRAWRALLEATRDLTRRLDSALQRLVGIDLRTYDVLFQLSEAAEGRRMTDLADAIVLSKSGLTALVDRLQEEGWIDRRPDPSDRRVTLVALTEAGSARYRAAAAHHRAVVHEIFFSAVTEAEAAVMAAGLERVRRRLSEDASGEGRATS